MNKLKNIGISALAGTLVTLSAAQAGGGVSVSGSYELSYTTLDHAKVSGNKLGVNKNITFGSSGDLSDGGGVTWATTVAMNDGFSGLSSASLSINMGGIATLTYDSGTGGTGANAVDNIIPTAWEEIDYGFATGISDLGAVSASKGVVNLTVKAPVAGTGFSVSYASRMGAGHTSDGAVSGGADGNTGKGVDVVLDFVDYNAAHAGFRWGVAGQVELPENTCDRQEKDRRATQGLNSLHTCSGLKHSPYAGSMFTKLQLGPIHLGTQATFKNLATNGASEIMNQRSIVGGIAAVFGDTLSLSYGVAYDKYRYNDRNRGMTAYSGNNNRCAAGQDDPQPDGGQRSHVCGGDEHEYITQKYKGWSAALNLGPVALKGTRNKVDGGEATSIYEHDTTHSEINLSIAF